MFKLTPNDFLFKFKTKYTVMFGILITSAVYTWHFVYVTVLFCFFLGYFSFMVVLWSAASYREAKTTERWHSEMEEKRRRRPKADRQPQLSSQYEAAGLWRGHPPVLFLLPSLDGGGGGVGHEGVGGVVFSFFLTLPLMIRVVRHHPLLLQM